MKKRVRDKKIYFSFYALFFLFSSLTFASAVNSIDLDGINGEVRINNSQGTNVFNEATWSMWLNQREEVNNSGLIGRYFPALGQRSYLIRTADSKGLSIVLSNDGTQLGTYRSITSRECGIRDNNEWTMITITYNGSLITYYRNGVKCDQDQTAISSLHASPSPVRFGGGNNIFFSGSIDEFKIYNKTLDYSQIIRLYNESSHGNDLGQSIPVLVYHKVDNGASETIKVSPEKFAQQMDYLKKNNFTTITLRDYYNWRIDNYTIPEKAIIIAFDDGFKSVYTNAKPIIDQHGFVASVVAVTRYASFTSSNSGYMNWTNLKSLYGNGWSIESHGVTHSHSLKLNEKELRSELVNSKQIITEKIGETPSSFVFPFHESDEEYTEICAEYYSLCWTQGSANPTYNFKSTPGDKYHSLRRINVINAMTIDEFANALRKDTDIVGEWDMEEGIGNITEDTSGNHNHATLLNGAFWALENNYASLFATSSTLRSLNLAEEIYNIENIESSGKVIDSDKNKKEIKMNNKKKWPDNMAIEEDKYYPPLEKKVKNKSKKNKK